MIRPESLFAALISAAVLTTPTMARQSKMTQRVTANANARAATDTHNAYGQACCRNRAGDFRGLAERDVWGHWGAYYGPMVP